MLTARTIRKAAVARVSTGVNVIGGGRHRSTTRARVESYRIGTI